MLKLIYITVFGFIGLILSGCGIYKPVTVGKIKAIRLVSLNFEEITFKLIIPVENPNGYKFRIVGSEVEIALNDKQLTNITVEDDVEVPKKFNGEIEVPVKVKLKGMFDAGTIAIVELFNKRGTELTIKGYVKVKAGIISKKIKIDEKSNVSIFRNKKNE